MKKLITLLFTTCLAFTMQAQYCGHTGNPSDSGQCAATALERPGLSPVDSVIPLLNGEESTTVIQFQNYDTVTFGTYILTLQWLRIDSIGNLPNGLCWATNKSDNKFNNKEAGCIKLNGTVCDTPGQYRLKIIHTPHLGVPLQETYPFYFLLRLKNNGDTDVLVDTNQTNPFIPYGNPIAGCTPTDINETEVLHTTLRITPNPFTNKAAVHFFSNKTGTYTQTITNLTGIIVYQNETQVMQGGNDLTIDAGNLSAGVYFYIISNGINRVTKRIVIE